MSQNYISFRKFSNATEAKHLQSFLIDNGIECVFIDSASYLGTSISGRYADEYEVHIKPSNFERANILLEEEAGRMFNEIDEDYYLLSFTDEELYDVVLKQDEWSEFDYLLSRKLLTERGKIIDESLMKSLRKQRIEDLAKPEANQHAWIIAGYVFALLGGVLGIIIGYVLYTSKKTLPNGTIVPTYNNEDRKHGKTIFIMGVVALPIIIFLRVFIKYLETS